MNVLNYVLYNTLETGSYGKVYVAQNLLTQEKCVIKMFHHHGTLKNLRHEYKLMAQLEHPNIIRPLAYFEQLDRRQQKQGYIVLEKGETDMFEYLRDNFDIVEYINFIYDIIKGLEYLHSQNIVHCDIKLENIIIKEQAKITDFGLSVKLKNNIPRRKVSFRGTCGLAAPEIVSDGYCCHKSDIWSLGKLMQHIEKKFYLKGIQNYPLLSDLFIKCLEWDYKKRPTATQLLKMFEERYHNYLY